MRPMRPKPLIAMRIAIENTPKDDRRFPLESRRHETGHGSLLVNSRGRRKTRILTRRLPRSTEADSALKAAVERDVGRGAATLAVAVSGGKDSVYLLHHLVRNRQSGGPRIVVLS